MLNLKNKKQICIGLVSVLIITGSISINVFAEKGSTKSSSNTSTITANAISDGNLKEIDSNSNKNSKVVYQYETSCNVSHSTFALGK